MFRLLGVSWPRVPGEGCPLCDTLQLGPEVRAQVSILSSDWSIATILSSDWSIATILICDWLIVTILICDWSRFVFVSAGEQQPSFSGYLAYSRAQYAQLAF